MIQCCFKSVLLLFGVLVCFRPSQGVLMCPGKARRTSTCLWSLLVFFSPAASCSLSKCLDGRALCPFCHPGTTRLGNFESRGWGLGFAKAQISGPEFSARKAVENQHPSICLFFLILNPFYVLGLQTANTHHTHTSLCLVFHPEGNKPAELKGSLPLSPPLPIPRRSWTVYTQ